MCAVFLVYLKFNLPMCSSMGYRGISLNLLG